MIGLGTWEAPINTMIFRGTGRVTISDVNGEYDFNGSVPVTPRIKGLTVNLAVNEAV